MGFGSMKYQAIIFDLGGVVFTSPGAALQPLLQQGHASPANIFQSYEEEGPWARFERGEINETTFCAQFDAQAQSNGLQLSARAVLDAIATHLRPRPSMLQAIRWLRSNGYRVAALTNNWDAGDAFAERVQELHTEFDVFVESCKVGMRKPEARIYHHVLAALDLEPHQVVFLDDFGVNLKAAKALGITTLKVEAAAPALAALGEILGEKIPLS